MYLFSLIYTGLSYTEGRFSYISPTITVFKIVLIQMLYPLQPIFTSEI